MVYIQCYEINNPNLVTNLLMSFTMTFNKVSNEQLKDCINSSSSGMLSLVDNLLTTLKHNYPNANYCFACNSSSLNQTPVVIFYATDLENGFKLIKLNTANCIDVICNEFKNIITPYHLNKSLSNVSYICSFTVSETIKSVLLEYKISNDYIVNGDDIYFCYCLS